MTKVKFEIHVDGRSGIYGPATILRGVARCLETMNAGFPFHYEASVAGIPGDDFGKLNEELGGYPGIKSEDTRLGDIHMNTVDLVLSSDGRTWIYPSP